MTATIPDSDVLDALDWHHEQACDRNRCAADHPPARWWTVNHRCPCAPTLWCEPCRQVWLGWLRSVDAVGCGLLTCSGCGGQWLLPAAVAPRAVTIEPLT